MKTKVLIVISNMEFGGAQRQIIELVNNIEQDKFEVHVCSLSKFAPLAMQFNENIAFHTVHKKSKFDFSVVFKLAKLIRKHKFHIAHSYLFDAEIAVRLAAKISLRKIKVIGSERNANYLIKPIQKKAYYLTRNMVCKIIANSQSGATYNAQQTGQPNSKYHVIYNGVNTNRFIVKDKIETRRSLGITQDCKLIGMFASFKQQKNHFFLIDTLEQLRKTGVEFKLLLVGEELHGGLHGSDDYSKELKYKIKKSNFSNDVIFLGNRADVENIYPACDITILPSLFEGTPNVVLESMACGIPVIATDVSDNNVIIDDSINGFIVPLNNISILQDRIMTLFKDDRLIAEMRGKSRQKISQNYSSIKLAENTQSIYKIVIDK